MATNSNLTRDGMTRDMRTWLAKADDDGVILRMPHTIAVGLARRGYGEYTSAEEPGQLTRHFSRADFRCSATGLVEVARIRRENGQPNADLENDPLAVRAAEQGWTIKTGRLGKSLALTLMRPHPERPDRTQALVVRYTRDLRVHAASWSNNAATSAWRAYEGPNPRNWVGAQLTAKGAIAG
jgi:hypothetical protein